MRNLINPETNGRAEIKVGYRTFRIGDKVMQTKNIDPISNGDMGFVKSIGKDKEGAFVIVVEFSENRTVTYLTDDMKTIEHCYVTTVHKSQGGEYETVIIPLLNSMYIMLQRNLIYTAITRAKQKLVFVGQKSALHMAVSRNDVDNRNTRLAERIVLYNKERGAKRSKTITGEVYSQVRIC